MNSIPLFIYAISQLDNHTFKVDWSDGSSKQYRLSELQKNCPCASCVDETTGQRRAPLPVLQEDVRAISISNVGQYALKITFSAGCSKGIYSYRFLRQLSEKISGDFT